MNKELRIFIVEDEVLVAFEMSDVLEDLGFEIVGPSVHLTDAQRVAREARIDIAFLDVNLGRGQTSKPVARILRERGIPFIYITAYDRNQVTFITDDDQLLRKPVSGPELLYALRAMFPEREV